MYDTLNFAKKVVKEIHQPSSVGKALLSNANTLVNLENYGPYAPIAKYDHFVIDLSSITANNWNEHYQSVLNILKDGIYTERVQHYMITVDFGDVQVELSLIDYWFNLIMWSMLIYTDIKVRPKHIFFFDEFKANDIKKYVDKFFIAENRSKYTNRQINNIIADVLQCFHDVDIFSAYISNTCNLEDTAELMSKDKDFYDCLHASFANLPMDTVKDVSMKYTRKSIERIKNAKAILGRDHCLADAWRAGEGINVNQYREVTINIGTKPDGRGGVFPEIIDRSFVGGGVTNPIDYFIESSTGRIAQIIKFKNVRTSGAFARILGLNNMDSFLYGDTTYNCNTQNLLYIYVKNANFLEHLNLMYYRLFPDGHEMRINKEKDSHLIGQWIYLRSPITCASAANGRGVCYRCYGDLAYSVFDVEEGVGINIGRIAAEVITAKITQMQLSVKHLLEAKIEKVEWNEAFDNFFDINTNVIQLTSEIDYKDYKILIDPDAIEMETEDTGDVNEDDEISAALNFNEYIIDFDVVKISTGEVFHISNNRDEHLYMTEELNAIIRRKGEPIDDKISIGFNEVKEMPLFIMILENNEISKVLDKLKRLYNKADNTKGKTISQLFQEILDTNIEGNMNVSAVHYAILLMNQVRDEHDMFTAPDWYYRNPGYQILTLNEALNNNPSITISLSYQKINKMFYSPLTWKKHGASFIDLFFMKRPQRIIRGIDDREIVKTHNPGELWEPIKFVDDPNTVTAEDVEAEAVVIDNDV